MKQNNAAKKNKFSGRFLSGLFIATIFSIILNLSLLGSTVVYGVSNEWTGAAATSFAGGTGTEGDPYLISTAEQLAYFANQVNNGSVTYEGKYIILTQDILFNRMNANGSFVSGSPRQFTSIGSAAKPFKGTFDGCGFEIIGLYNVLNWVSCQGLFGYADTGSVIRSIKISGSITGGEKTGAVAGCTEGKITGCNSSSVVSGTTKIGGIAGYAAGTGSEISNCNFTGTARGNGDCIGGIAWRSEGLINGCAIDATVEGASGTIGGIAGYAAGAASVISNCTIAGTVRATGGYGYVGGAAGKTDGKISGCVSECSVIATGQHYVGGVAGTAGTGSEISNSSSSGSVSGTGKVGGIAGYTDGEIAICINTGDVNGGGSGYTGGVAGEAGNNSTVSNSFNSGAVSGGGQGNIGGIVGYAGEDTTVHHNLNKGTVEGTQNVGSIIGNGIDQDNAWNNYYYDYTGAPGGVSGTDIEDDDGAVPVGDLTWEEIQELLNENNDAGDDIWNQDLDDDGVPKPSEGGSGSASVFKIESAAVKEGRYYTAAQLGEGAAATVTAESVFTAAFGLEYKMNCAPEEQTLKLKNDHAAPLPAGTSIIMLAGEAYYYINLTAPAAAIALGDFLQMGGAGLPYSPAPAAKDDVSDYLFIFDFSKTAPADLIPAGSYSVELSHPGGGHSGALPAVTVAGVNEYDLSVGGAVNDQFTVSVNRIPVSGYDYKTDGKEFACEFYLEKEGASGTETVPLPVGAKINGSFVSAVLPYAFLPVDLNNTATVVLDMSECADPLAAGEYTLRARVYSGADILNPRGGYLLADGSKKINLTAPAVYAIKANAAGRLFDQSADPIPVAFTIQTLGGGSVKATLQQKYAMGYLDMEGQVDQPVAIAGEKATLYLPGETPKGTYRFVLTPGTPAIP